MSDLHGQLIIGCRQHLLTLPVLPASRAWWDRGFVPTVGTPWLRETWRPVLSVPAGPGTQALEEHRILYELAPHYPAIDGGPAAASAMADAIRRHFRAGVFVSYGQSFGTVFRCERGPMQISADWASFLVTATIVMYATQG